MIDIETVTLRITRIEFASRESRHWETTGVGKRERLPDRQYGGEVEDESGESKDRRGDK